MRPDRLPSAVARDVASKVEARARPPSWGPSLPWPVGFARAWVRWCQCGLTDDAADEERWLEALRDHAARLTFPGWAQALGDWTSLYTHFNEDGTPITEVAVYRDHERIHYRMYVGQEVIGFWTRLLSEIAVARFRREVSLLAGIRNAYVAPLVGASLTKPPYWLATSYVEGKTLAQAVAHHGPLPPAVCTRLLGELAAALADLHRQDSASRPQAAQHHPVTRRAATDRLRDRSGRRPVHDHAFR